MKIKQTKELFEKHLLALARACLKRMERDDNFYGGITMDCKRPFGNSMRCAVTEDTLCEIGCAWDLASASEEDEKEMDEYVDRLWSELPSFLRDRVRLDLK